ncbi:MAG: AAA domain-containing protein [Ruminococcus flavefaciens]|nr:AAA domain-containing protein [Ruminococcus flavefaciens]
MIINELVMNQDSCFTDIQCRMTIKQKIVAKNGRVEMFGDNQFKFITKDNVIDFSIVDKNEAKLIMESFNRHFYCLANVTSCSDYNDDGKVFFLHIGFFYNLQRWGKTPVIISDEMKNNIEKKYVKSRETIEQVLEENFKLSDGVSSYFVYTSGKYYFGSEEQEENETESVEKISESSQDTVTEKLAASEDEVEKDKALDRDKIEKIIEKDKQKKDTLVIYGREFYIYVSIQGDKFNEKLYVEKIGKRKQNAPMMRMAEGTLEFFDHNSILSKKVKETLESTKGYLDLWNQYAEQEGNLLLEEVRKVGLITVNRGAATFDSEGIHLPYSGLTKEAEELISSDTYLFFSDEIPVYLADSEMTWSDYRTLLKEASQIGYSINKGAQVRVNKRKNGGFIIEAEDGHLPEQKYVSLSILGDERQISRREDARKRIAEGKAANPALGLILEGQLTEELEAYSTRKKIMPLSSFVKDKIFKYDPTETQKKAIDIALNTPDIAIIQGPPGTGKTTVITAIIERLNELCDKREKVNGQVLITSFQHDAVRNVIERLRINSLPTIKFGKQERAGEEDLTRERVIEKWCEEYIARLNEKNPELIETEKRNRLSRLHNMYLIYPSDKNALEFLQCAKEINTDVDLDKKISRLIEPRSVSSGDRTSELLMLIRRLRTTKEGFMDDGADNADYLLQNLEDMGINQGIPENRKVFDILDEAAVCYGKEPSEELLGKLCDVKTYLLDKCVPKPSYKKEVPDEEISKIYKQINQSVKKHQDEKAAILADLLKELRTNRSEVERSLEHYLFVYSATTQQSEGIEIKEAKGINKYSDEHPEYETVIVDEAARVSPADLMIPLAQAKKRIILVGDHRQLPHIYDEEVFESMKENGETVDMNNIKKSMFEYLLEKARDLEKIDNVPRTIVLDAQYRMHPMLGEFVNEVFYKPNDEQFASPLPASNYQQFISKKTLPLEWYDFPDKYGKEHKEGTSRVRDCEVDFIVEKIEYYMNLEEGKKLSYGVITFYSEQVKSIKRKLKNKLGDDAKRVRVGSVDAFQGMEFDVIFLSVVRSNDRSPMVRIDKNSKPEPINYEYLEKYKDVDRKQIDKKSNEYKEWESYRDKVGMQNYGFLISENRLCVSLSRQKKLLIVVGNTEMFCKDEWGRIAEICVLGMKKLYELCKGEDVIYDGQSESV